MNLDELIDEITTDAYGEDEQLWAFRQALEDVIAVPCEATVIGEPVQVLKFDYDGNMRRGLTATCRRPDGAKYVVAALEVVIPREDPAGRYLAAYRKWMGVAPFPRRVRPAAGTQSPVAMGLVELVVLSVKQRTARCRFLDDDQNFTFRIGGIRELVPGDLALVKPSKRWTYGGNPYLSGTVESTRLDVSALGLTRLSLVAQGMWNPAEHHWGEKKDPVADWAKPIIARGPRPAFEMEQVLSGADDDEDPFSDPISQSNDLKDGGDPLGAYKILMDLCQRDLRCLDAHSHLGNLRFDRRPEDAIRHYEVGFRIGELSLGDGFDGLLPWGMIDNRPFLRCMHGFGLCLWRLGRHEEARGIFERMLWLNPADNQGVGLVIEEVRAGMPWHDD